MSSLSNIDTQELISSKENIQPLRRGRDTSILCTALQAETDSEAHQELEKQRNEFEIKLRSSSSEDPLADWCTYINWIEQSFPRQPREGKLNIVLQKCINKFKDCEKYMNDVRFVKICIKYAEIEGNSVELLKQIHGHGIGVNCAEFYITWAEKYAIDNCFKKANAVYEKGLKSSAQPKELLEEAFRNFQAFLVRKMLNEQETFQPTVLEENSSEETRQPYNVLQTLPRGNKEVVPSVRIGSNVVGVPGVIQLGKNKESKLKSNEIIKVFEDPDNCYSEADAECKISKIQSKKKSTKENMVKPGVWTNKYNKQIPFSVGGASSLPFEVHKDEEEKKENIQPKAVPPSVLKPHRVKSYYEDENFATAPLFYPEPYDPTKRPMYCKEMVYAGGLEFQFEELRAMQYRRKKEIEKLSASDSSVLQPTSKESQLSPSTSNVPETKMLTASASELSCREKSSETLKNRRKSLLSTPQNFESPKTNLPSEGENLPTIDNSMNHTIHTKEALSEMQQLWFSKPASPISNIPKPIKTISKSILKPSKPGFNLYIDESCLENIKPLKENDLETPSDLTFNVEDHKNIGNEINHVVESDNCKNAKVGVGSASNMVKKYGSKPKPLVENCKENLHIPDGKETNNEKVESNELKNQDEGENKEVDQDFSTIMQFNNTAITETWNFTKGFQFPRGESTPNIRKSIHNKENCNESAFENENKEMKEEVGKSSCENETDNEKQKAQSNEKKPGYGAEGENFPKNLSVIAETSREYRSSSSGSSGASTLTSRSSKNFYHTPSEGKSNKFNITSQTTFSKHKRQSLGCEGSNEINSFKCPTSNKENIALNTTLDLMTKLNAIEGVSIIDNSKPDIEKDKSVVKESSEVKDAAQESKDIDPFCDKLIEKLLEGIDFPNEQHVCGFYLLNNINFVPPKVGSATILGTTSFDVKKALGEGSYAKIYKLVNNADKTEMIAKFQKPPCPWEFYITREVQTRIGDSDLASFFMDVEAAYFFKNASVLLTKPVEFGDLLNVINKMKQGNIMCQSLAMYFTSQILRILETLHSLQIIHGDIKPDNLLLRQYNNKLQLQLIDFGRGIDMSLFPEGTKFTRVVTTKSFTTVEMKLGKPWTYQIDLYGLANCGHCLLFGDYMKVIEKGGIWNITKVIPRYWARTEWKNFFVNLLNVESCTKLPNLAELREPFDLVLQESCELEFNLFKLQNLLSKDK